MKSTAKHPRSKPRATTDGMPSGAFVVPSHGRLARRGSTEIVEDEAEQGGGSKDASGASR
jgi:hypothetical protein